MDNVLAVKAAKYETLVISPAGADAVLVYNKTPELQITCKWLQITDIKCSYPAANWQKRKANYASQI